MNAITKLIGRITCWRKGKHVERRATGPNILHSDGVHPIYNRECTICGAKRYSKPRKIKGPV